MLYRKPRPFVVRTIAETVARIAGFVAGFQRTGSDMVYLDTLNANELRDVGIQRIVTRDEQFYR